MKKWTIIYWVTTAIFALLMLLGGVMDILLPEEVILTATQLGYPLYFITLLGILKVMGGVTLLLPVKLLNPLKEWAYAGFAFDLIFASYSHLSVGHLAQEVLMPMLFLVFLIISYFAWKRMNAAKS